MTVGARIVLVLLTLSLVAGIVTGSSIYFRLSYVWAVLLVGTWLWSWQILRGVKLSRKARTTRAQVGQIYEEKIELDNTGWLPRLWLAVSDRSTLPDSAGSRLFPVIESRRGRTYLSRTRLLKRGVFPLGPTALESGDPFGLFPVERVYPASESLLVYPLLVEVHDFPSPAGVLPGGEALRRRTFQVTPNAAGIREYAPGDSMNRIHWVSTARRNRLMTKEFELDPQAEVWIFLDASQTGQAAIPFSWPKRTKEDLWKHKFEFTLPPTTEEYGVCIAASIARFYLSKGRSVGFITSGQNLTMIPPDRGGRQLGKILESLALLRAEGTLPIWGLIDIQAQHLTRGSTIVLITHSVEKEVMVATDFLARRGLRPVVVMIDAGSFNGPEGTDEIADGLRYMRVPLRIVHRDDDITSSLSFGS
ncbi:MAG: DUF58 domain-containing protein [Anaerolineales bacterium]